MVKIHVHDGICETEVSGNMQKILEDLMTGIGAIYNTFKSADSEKAADLFQIGLVLMMAPENPAWEPRENMVTINKAKKNGTPTDQS